jgi:hypothetical protein
VSLAKAIKWQRDILEATKRMLVVERDNADHTHAQAIRQIITNVDAAILFNKEISENLQANDGKVRCSCEGVRAGPGESVPS